MIINSSNHRSQCVASGTFQNGSAGMGIQWYEVSKWRKKEKRMQHAVKFENVANLELTISISIAWNRTKATQQLQNEASASSTQ